MYTNPVSKPNWGWLCRGSAQLQASFACAIAGMEGANQVKQRENAAERPLQGKFLHSRTQVPSLGLQIKLVATHSLVRAPTAQSPREEPETIL